MWLKEDMLNENGGSEGYRILETKGGEATLKYIAQDQPSATHLIAALEWYQSLKEGVLKAPPSPSGPKSRKGSDGPVRAPKTPPTKRTPKRTPK